MLESNGDNGEPCGTPSSFATTTPSGITILAFSNRPISTSSRRSGTRCASRDISRWWQTRSKNFSRSMSTTHPYPSCQMLLGLLDRRVATTTRSEPVTRRVKRRLEHRLEYLSDGLTDHPVDHVRDAQPALTSTHLRDHHPASRARSIAPIQQSSRQPRTRDRPLLTQLADRLPIRSGRSLVRHHLHKRRRQTAHNPFHRHRRDRSALTIASGTPAWPVPDRFEATTRADPRGSSAVAIGRQSCHAV